MSLVHSMSRVDRHCRKTNVLLERWWCLNADVSDGDHIKEYGTHSEEQSRDGSAA